MKSSVGYARECAIRIVLADVDDTDSPLSRRPRTKKGTSKKCFLNHAQPHTCPGFDCIARKMPKEKEVPDQRSCVTMLRHQGSWTTDDASNEVSRLRMAQR